MKKKQLLLWATVCFLLASCGKSGKNHISTWYIDGKKYETRELNGYQFSDVVKLKYTAGNLSEDDIFLGMRFNLNYFPQNGSFDIIYGGAMSTEASIGFILNGTQYLVGRENATVVKAYNNDGKGKYVIEPTWFYSQLPDSVGNGFIRGDDSVFFTGELYEPEEVYSRL